MLPVDHLGQVGVLARQDARRDVDDGDLAAEAPERLRHLAADRTAADDDQARHVLAQVEQRLVGEAPASARPGIGGIAGREPVAITNVFAGEAAPVHFERVGRHESPVAQDDVDAERAEALGAVVRLDPADHAGDALHDQREVDLAARARIAQRSAWRIACATFADLMSVFDGTQPYHRQSPPILCFSTSATFAPSEAPPAATTSPPAPPPITTMSNSGAGTMFSVETKSLRGGPRSGRAPGWESYRRCRDRRREGVRSDQFQRRIGTALPAMATRALFSFRTTPIDLQ